MAKKPPVSYAALELQEAPAATHGPAATTQPARRGRPQAKRTLKEASAPVMLYLDPAGLKALKRYALDQNTKVHSLLLDAVEAWFRSHGLREPVRVQTSRKSRKAPARLIRISGARAFKSGKERPAGTFHEPASPHFSVRSSRRRCTVVRS